MSIIFFQLVCNGNLLNIQIHHEFGVRAFIEENIVFQFYVGMTNYYSADI